jgi:hypothetical protein
VHDAIANPQHRALVALEMSRAASEQVEGNP